MGNLFCCVQVDQSTVAIKETFGKFEDVLEPGCHFLPWCLGSQVAGYLSLRVQQLDVRCETKTKVLESSINTLFIRNYVLISFNLRLIFFGFVFLQDNVFVNVVASIQYRALANKANDAYYKLSNTRGQIQAYVFDGKSHC